MSWTLSGMDIFSCDRSGRALCLLAKKKGHLIILGKMWCILGHSNNLQRTAVKNRTFVLITFVLKTRGTLTCCTYHCCPHQGHRGQRRESFYWRYLSSAPDVAHFELSCNPSHFCDTVHIMLLSCEGKVEKFSWVWAVLSLAPVALGPKLIHLWTDSFA